MESSLSVPGEEKKYIAYLAYPRHPFEEGSVTNMLTSIVVNVFGFKALRAPRLFANPYCLYSFKLSKARLMVSSPGWKREIAVNQYGRPLLGCTM